VIWWLLGCLAVIAAIPIAVEALRKPVTQAERDEALGQIADLKSGKTYFQWRGPANGPTVICIHGLTTPSFAFDGIVPDLVNQGYRVLTYDLYGRGLSARPFGRQSRQFFLRQLNQLLLDQNVGRELVVIGYSMGGSIAAAFAAENPKRVRQLILLASAGLDPGQGPAGIWRMPVIGDWLRLTFGAMRHRAAIRAGNERSTAVPDIAERQMAEADRRGFNAAVLSSRRGMLAEDMTTTHQSIAKAGVPTLAIWGEVDDVITTSSIGKLSKANRSAYHVTVPDAGHGLPYTHPTAVSIAIAKALEHRKS